MRKTSIDLTRYAALAALAVWSFGLLGARTAEAQTTITGTTNDDRICVYYSNVWNYNVAVIETAGGGGAAYFGGFPPAAVTTPLLIEGLDGNDKITIYDDVAFPNDCTCVPMLFDLPSNFIYGGGTVTIEGGEGDDLMSGGSGTDIIYGDKGDDSLHGFAGGDTLYGGDGDDLVLDYGGTTNDAIYGENDEDCMGDCSIAPGVCDGGAGADAQVSCGGCASVAMTGANCGYFCPENPP